MLTELANGTAFRVLYVENDPQMAADFNQAFGQTASITVARSLKEALYYLEAEPDIDLVVFNDRLNSTLFLNAVRNNPVTAKVSTILLTDNPSIDLHAEPFRGRVIDVFNYGYAEESLQTRLSYLIRKKQYAETGGNVEKPVQVRMPIWKRVFDFVGAFILLLLLSPILLVVAILVKLDSKGPIFYGSKRVGMGYKVFNMYKFRTMRTDADKMLSSMASLNMYNTKKEEEPADALCEACQLAGTGCQRPLFLDDKQVCEDVHFRTEKAKAMFSKFKEDPRVTRLGKFLRNTSIDELPQFYNILRGDMSFVGNRPLPPYEAEKLTAAGYARRFAAPAGLTGLWQVTKRGGAAVSDQERIQLDVLYAKKFSFKTDLMIVIRTLKAVWQKENV
ncbi:lipopolysaccharide/colanic/teichoic acid biosynthesis glycosyltransferase [Larkinella arboricola]|uniref:Lipopolysaccharide/colanic/teichoic acid biosynthesis glycosyltransferase n=2 Tax=Larkinella arboricola TaxID=643671 RepID=A0A327WWV1_LARAB|nr:lipopolysaccharide/colanic/teichoic acid biosynthesis glycosyltransferase [Larkinella arboricola]